MIENESQLQATLGWVRYWKANVADGEQSWLGGENAREELMRYQRAIADYQRRRSDDRAKDERAGAASEGVSRASHPLGPTTTA